MAILQIFRRAAPRALSVTSRPFHTSTLSQAYKSTQDRNSLDPQSREHTLSGTNDDVTKQSEAFDPSKTRPEEEANTDNPASPLHASGANQKFNKPQGDERQAKPSGAGDEIEKGGKSGDKNSSKKGSPLP